MKIGILTFHRAHNYGAVLQCYALQEVLKGMGHDVKVIDYRQPAIEKTYNTWGIWILIKKIIKFWKLIGYLVLLNKERKKRKIFDCFKDDYLIIRNKCCPLNIPKDCDIYVVGSDQLFTTVITHGLDPVYCGRFERSPQSKLIGYAISSNVMAIKEIGIGGWKEIASRFDAISMREKTLADNIYELTQIRFDVCVDPTLLTTAETWSKMTRKSFESTGYVVMYEVRKLKNDKMMLRRKAEELASRNHLQLVDLSSMYNSVENWVNCIKNAKCVVTTSFHASVFALIFERPLYAFKLEDGCDDRYTDLLEYVGLSNSVKGVDDTPTVIPEIDYNNVRCALTEYKKQSLDFLSSNLK